MWHGGWLRPMTRRGRTGEMERRGQQAGASPHRHYLVRPVEARLQPRQTKSGRVGEILGDCVPFRDHSTQRKSGLDGPRDVQIIGLFHTEEHLRRVSRQLLAGSDPMTKAPLDERCHEPHEGRFEAVESGCTSIVGTRLKRSETHWTADGASAILPPGRCAKRRRSGTCDELDQPRPGDISRTCAPPSALMGPEGTLPRHTAHGGRPGSPRVEVGCWGQSRNRANPWARPLPAAESPAVPEEGAAAVDGPSLGRPGWTLDRFRPFRRSATRRSLARRAATREAVTGCRAWACGSRPGAR